MKSKDRAGCALIVTLVVLGVVVLNVARSCQFLTRSRLIDVEALPPGWQVDDDGPHPVPQAPLGGRESIESISLSFHLPERAGAYEEIYLFENSRKASRYYAKRMERAFRHTEWDDPWTVPEELLYQSSNANQFCFACDESTSVTPMRGCMYIAQYGSYVVLFNISWIPGYSMNYTDLEGILQALDREF